MPIEAMATLAELARRPGWRVEWFALFDGAWASTIVLEVIDPNGKVYGGCGWLDEWGEDGETPPVAEECAHIARQFGRVRLEASTALPVDAMICNGGASETQPIGDEYLWLSNTPSA